MQLTTFYDPIHMLNQPEDAKNGAVAFVNGCSYEVMNAMIVSWSACRHHITSMACSY